jgi:hypothetical protein
MRPISFVGRRKFMGLITKEVEIKIGTKNTEYFKSLGYKMPIRKNKWGDWVIPRGSKIIVKIEDLLDNSKILVKIQCDHCHKIYDAQWNVYKRYVRYNELYYCSSCAPKLGTDKMIKTKLEQSESFESWCIKHNKQDILSRWDYSLNSLSPNKVCYSSHKKYYFLCDKGYHKSELKFLDRIVSGQSNIHCCQCGSFANWGLNNIDNDFIKKYWDDTNKLDVWKLSYGSRKKVLICCQKADYHPSYWVTCNDFVQGKRCPYCSKKSGKIHPLDSLGNELANRNLIYLFSDKNERSPYEYSPMAHKKMWWKCPDNKHQDFYRGINESNRYNFRCPECQCSLGEQKIKDFLINNNITYISQKTFDNLIGLGGGLLSYDFYIEGYGLCEFNGIQHEQPVDFLGEGKTCAEKRFKKQQIHDELKREYAKNHNIELLVIWYKDFDNIEKILEEKLLRR